MTLPKDRPIPDRLAADSASYDSEFARQLSITLDGIPQKWVLEYCISEGWVRRVARDMAGHIVTKGDAAAEETVKGVVVVTVKL